MGTSGYCSCGGRNVPSRKIVINAFHDPEDARLEAPRCSNGTAVPADFAGVVGLAERYKADGPIDQIEIAAHGTGLGTPWGSLPGETDAPGIQGRRIFRFGGDDPESRAEQRRYQLPAERLRPGAAILGTTAEIVSGMSMETNATHAILARRLGRCVSQGGRIVWQCCDLGFAMEPYQDFLSVFLRIIGPGIRVEAAMGLTRVGTEGIQGGAGAYEGHRIGQDGVIGPIRGGDDPGPARPTVGVPAARRR